jgi:hypothetical protein
MHMSDQLGTSGLDQRTIGTDDEVSQRCPLFLIGALGGQDGYALSLQKMLDAFFVDEALVSIDQAVAQAGLLQSQTGEPRINAIASSGKASKRRLCPVRQSFKCSIRHGRGTTRSRGRAGEI